MQLHCLFVVVVVSDVSDVKIMSSTVAVIFAVNRDISRIWKVGGGCKIKVGGVSSNFFVSTPPNGVQTPPHGGVQTPPYLTSI